MVLACLHNWMETMKLFFRLLDFLYFRMVGWT
jgi:hypothetical protein